MIEFRVPGPPQNWQRANIVGGRVLTDAKSRAYSKHVRACAALAMRGQPMTAARLGMDILVTYTDKRRRDLDNLAKQIGDALNGLVYVDDSQVDDLRVRRVAGEVGVTVRVYALEESKS